MAFTFNFNKKSMDIIMTIVRKYNVNPSEAVDMLIANPRLIKESNDGTREGSEIYEEV